MVNAPQKGRAQKRATATRDQEPLLQACDELAEQERPTIFDRQREPVARVLLQSQQPAGGATIHSRLRSLIRGEVGESDVMEVLRTEPAFELLRGRGWMLGQPCS